MEVMIERIITAWDSESMNRFRQCLGLRIVMIVPGVWVLYSGAGWEMPDWMRGTFWMLLYYGGVLTGKIGMEEVRNFLLKGKP